MKKVIMTAIVAVFSMLATQAQTSFGVTAGMVNVSAKSEASFMGQSISVSEAKTGFYVGAFADISVSESFSVVPGVNYVGVEDANQIYVPIMAHYYFGDSGFFAQAGPEFRYILEENTSDDFSKLGIDLGLGAGYDITEKFFVEARYAFQLNDHYTGSEDASSKSNTFNIGVGYRF